MKRFLVIASAFVIIAIGGAVFFVRTKNPELKTVRVERESLSEEVIVTGKTKPVSSAGLAFEESGKVSKVLVGVGSTVKSGDILAELDRAQRAAELREAEAALLARQADLDELQRGTRPEEISIKEAELAKAEQDLANYYTAMVNILNDAYIKADDAVRSKTDPIFKDDETTNPSLTFLTRDAAAEADVIRLRLVAAGALAIWKNELPLLNASGVTRGDIDFFSTHAKEHLAIARDFLARVLDVVASAIGITQTTIDSYAANVYTARTNVTTVLTSVSDEEQLIAAQKLVVNTVQRELDLAEAGSTAEELRAAEAAVDQAYANTQTIQARINKTILRSPLKGTVVQQDAKVGEIVTAGTKIISVISVDDLEIEAFVPEVDIGRVSLEDPVSIKLDALSGETFGGTVSYIDPAESIVDGVVNFNVTIHFDALDARFKSGFTANLSIATLVKPDALVVPRTAIVENDSGTFVRRIRGGVVTEIPVTLGIRGNEGLVEVAMGVDEGDELVDVGFRE